VGGSGGGAELEIGSSTATSTSVTIPVVGISTSTSPKGQNATSISLAAALFSAPKGLMNTLQCIYEFLLILIVLYILASVLEDVLYKKEDLTAVTKRFYTKWTTMAVGLLIAGIIAYILGEYCLLLPILIAIILSLVWMALGRPKAVTTAGGPAWIPTNPFMKKTTVSTSTETKA
jgi:hypothetical protein